MRNNPFSECEDLKTPKSWKSKLKAKAKTIKFRLLMRKAYQLKTQSIASINGDAKDGKVQQSLFCTLAAVFCNSTFPNVNACL
jgi:hypothetical protein